MKKSTTPYATIGRKLPHSYSEKIHKAFGKYPFSLIELEPEEAREFMLHDTFKGITITIPYKKLALEVASWASPTARKIGCANTLLRCPDGTLKAYNTDYEGFKYMARKANVSFQGAKVLILGSGGTSLTTRTVAADEGAREVVIVSRSGEVNYGNVKELHADADIIINATPVGMYPNTAEQPIDLSAFPRLRAALDVIYNPMRTRFTQQAIRLGVAHCDALRMLVAQAFYAMEIFRGKKDSEAMIEMVTAQIRLETANIVLTGMPGSGKTTIGKLVAERMKRTFVDTDELIVEKAGMPIAEIFATKGEEAFRQIEAEVIADVSKQSSLVIATGGGAVLREENRLNLAQNGFVFWLYRPLEELQLGNGRPLSSSREAVAAMFAQREPLYRESSDGMVDNDRSPKVVSQRIIDVLDYMPL